MKLKVFAKDSDENKRETLEFVEEIKKHYDVEFIDLDGKEAAVDADIYNIYNSPTLLVVRDDGTETECWRGFLPRLSEVKLALNR